MSKIINRLFDKHVKALEIRQKQRFEYVDSGNDRLAHLGPKPNSQIQTKLLVPKLLVSWWEWPTILSLDAPFVAVLWQMLFIHSFQVDLRPLHSLLLFGTVWLIYVADRCFDSIVITEAYTARHAFYLRHFKLVLVFMSAIGVIIVSAALVGLEPTIFLHGCLLSSIVFLYLANLHLPNKPFLLIPKELQIGLVFAAGSTLTLWSQINATQTIFLGITSLCFATLCFLNCSFISLWEKSVDVLHKQPSLARANIAKPKLSFLLQTTTLVFVVICVLLPLGFELRLSFILSGLGLWMLHYTQATTSVKLKRVLADVVLMSPVLVLILL